MIDRQPASQPVGSRSPLLLPLWAERFVAPAVLLVGLALVAVTGLYLADALVTGETSHAIALIGLAAVVAVFFVDATAGLLLWIVLSPFGRLLNLTMGRGLPDVSLSRVAVAVLALLIAVQIAGGKRRFLRFGPVEITGLLFVLGMLAAVPASRLGWIGAIQSVFDTVLVPLMGFIFARSLIRSEADLRRFAVALAIVGATLGAIAMWEQLTHQAVLPPIMRRGVAYGQHSIKVMSLFGAPATMALTMVMPLPLTLVSALRARGLNRLPWLLAVAALLGGLLLTYVRAGWAVAVAGVVVLMLFAPSVRRHAPLITAVLVVAGVIFASGAIDVRSVTERLEAEGSITYRLEAVSVGLRIARSSPIFGLGLDNFSEAALSAGWRPVGGMGIPVVAPHNLFMYILISAGLLGLLPFAAYLAALLLRAWRLWRRSSGPLRDWPAVLLATLAGYALFVNTYDALIAQVATLLFMVIAGALVGMTEAAVQEGTGR